LDVLLHLGVHLVHIVGGEHAHVGLGVGVGVGARLGGRGLHRLRCLLPGAARCHCHGVWGRLHLVWERERAEFLVRGNR
jgi:hypothetical protein